MCKKAHKSKKVRDILPEKSQKVIFISRKIPKSQKVYKATLVAAAKTVSKSHFFCPKESQKVFQKISKSHFLSKKISKSHFYVNQMRRVGCRCGTFATQQHVRISECCKKILGWVADAVPLQHSCVSQNLNYKRTNEVFYRCSACVLMCVCDIFSLYIFVNNVFAFHCTLSSF